MNEKQKNEESGTPQSKVSQLDLNSLGTIAALLLSIIAISISVLEVTTMRTQQRAEVWPYLQINSSYSADSFKILLENKGVGPALVKSVNILVDNQPSNSGNFDSVIIDLVGKENAFSYDVYNISNPDKSVISSGEQVRIFSVPLQNRVPKTGPFAPGLQFAKESRERLNISLCYCSIHDDCWTTDMTMSGVMDTPSCE